MSEDIVKECQRVEIQYVVKVLQLSRISMIYVDS